MAKSALLEEARQAIRLRGYSLRTEKAYLGWIRRYIRFHNLSHPASMGGTEVTAFLSWLADERDVAVNTQKNGTQCFGISLPSGVIDSTW